VKLGERYRLELHWKKVNYDRKGLCKLFNAYFSGPALQIAAKMNNDDSINLDFYKQYLILVNNVYVARLSWKEVVYNKNNTITLKNAIISHDTELNRVPKLKNSDYIVIDTEKHEEETHNFYMSYDCFVIKEDGQLYNF